MATKFQNFVQSLGRGGVNLNSDALKVALSNSAPNAGTATVIGDITEIAAGNGYTAGGNAVGSNAYSQTSGTGKLTGSDVSFVASGGSIGPFQYAVLYDSTSNVLIGYYDIGSATTITDGNQFNVHWDATNGILQIA
jgi:hypothetical protein